MSFKDVYTRAKARVVCYMAASTDKWIKAAWANECSKKTHRRKRSLKKLRQMLR